MYALRQAMLDAAPPSATQRWYSTPRIAALQKILVKSQPRRGVFLIGEMTISAFFMKNWGVFLIGEKETSSLDLPRISAKNWQFSKKRARGVGSDRVKISPTFVENGKFANKECASISQIVVENSLFSREECAVKSLMFVKFCQFSNKERGVSSRVGSKFH